MDELDHLAMLAQKANRGFQRVLQTIPDPGGTSNIIVQQTSLIADTEPHPQQWMVTVAPPLLQGNPVLPWPSTFDGGNTAPNNTFPGVSGTNFNAPSLPVVGLALQLRWGAGGVAWQTMFDYPCNGAVFGVTADTLYLDVVPKAGTPVLYPALANVPMVAAYMVEGRPANPTPLRYLDLTSTIVTGQVTYWPVRPYARTIKLFCPAATAASVVQLKWLTAGDLPIFEQQWLATAQGFQVELDVPPSAFAYSLTTTDALTNTVTPMSELSFA